MKRAPVPASLQPSRFLAKCLGGLFVARGARAVDVGSGYGRHAHLLASLGYIVIALDYDLKALASLARPGAFPQGLLAVRCDLERGIPIPPGSAHLVVAIEYPDHRQMENIATLVAPGGHFVMETFTARGRNWMALPFTGSVRRFLEEDFRIVSLQEKQAGPPAAARSTVKVFAQRRWEPRHGALSGHRHQAW